jgi:hypothetical protein
VDCVRLILAVVHPRYAGVPSRCGVGFVGRFGPAAAAAEACGVLIGGFRGNWREEIQERNGRLSSLLGSGLEDANAGGGYTLAR